MSILERKSPLQRLSLGWVIELLARCYSMLSKRLSFGAKVGASAKISNTVLITVGSADIMLLFYRNGLEFVISKAQLLK